MNLGLNLGLGGTRGGGFDPASLFAAGEQGAWYDPSDLSTLFQDDAGLTPVTAAGQSVGLLLDKSQGLVEGSDVIVNGDFATDTWWGKDSAWTISGGVATYAGGTSNQLYTPLGILISGALYKVTFDVTAVTTAGALPLVSQGTTTLNVSATGAYTAFVFGAADGRLRFGAGTGSTWRGSIDNVVCRRIAGNHATQSNAAQRPTYGVVPATGRRNLVTFTEQFDNAAWQKQGLATTTANSITFGANVDSRIVMSVSGATGLSTVTASVRFSLADIGKTITLGIWTTTLNGVSSGRSPNLTIPSDGLVTYTWTSGVSGLNIFGILTDLAGGVKTVTLASGGGAQLETGSTATAYQRVGTAFDVTEAGVASRSYLSFDGTDDGMLTGNITPGTDKAQVFAGVRKLSDANVGTIAEFSPTSGGSTGALGLSGPAGAATNDYRWTSRGTATATIAPSGFTAPLTNVLTGIGDIAGDVATLRVNGVEAATTASDQGTGNFLTYPLYIGRRGGASLPLNGQIFGLIVRFGTNLSAATITQTETWLNQRTGAF
jgi:hypothetical protein